MTATRVSTIATPGARRTERTEAAGRAVAIAPHHPRPHATLEPAANQQPHPACPGLVLLGVRMVGRSLRQGPAELAFNRSWTA